MIERGKIKQIRLSVLPKPCKFCGALGHIAFTCRKKPKKPLKVAKKLKPRGKYGQQWIVTRETWFKKNPAEFYICYLCGKRMTPAETTLDHVKSRSRHPELRFNLENLRPACWSCQEVKGSKDLDELPERNEHGRN